MSSPVPTLPSASEENGPRQALNLDVVGVLTALGVVCLLALLTVALR
ncbi:hypothetical protein [Micromonospora sp. IBHARD004]